MEFWLDSDARRSGGLLLSAVYCEEAVDAMALMDVMPSGLELARFFVICPFCVALYIYFSGWAIGAVGNDAELPGWLARVHEVLIDMFDTLFFCMIYCFTNENMIKSHCIWGPGYLAVVEVYSIIGDSGNMSSAP